MPEAKLTLTGHGSMYSFQSGLEKDVREALNDFKETLHKFELDITKKSERAWILGQKVEDLGQRLDSLENLMRANSLSMAKVVAFMSVLIPIITTVFIKFLPL